MGTGDFEKNKNGDQKEKIASKIGIGKILGRKSIEIFAQGWDPVVDIKGVFAINQAITNVAINPLIRNYTGTVGNIPLRLIVIVFPVFRFKFKRKNPTIKKTNNDNSQNWKE